MAIRRLGAGDVAGCVAVLRRVYEASGYPGRWPADPAGWLGHRLTTAWVAIRGDQVIGHVGLAAGLEARCLREAGSR